MNATVFHFSAAYSVAFLTAAGSTIVALALVFWVFKSRIDTCKHQVAHQAETIRRLSSELEVQHLLVRQLAADIEEMRLHPLENRELTGGRSCYGGYLPVTPDLQNQILRRFQQGQPAATIASEFNVPQSEVELLLKIRDLKWLDFDPAVNR